MVLFLYVAHTNQHIRRPRFGYLRKLVCRPDWRMEDLRVSMDIILLDQGADSPQALEKGLTGRNVHCNNIVSLHCVNVKLFVDGFDCHTLWKTLEYIVRKCLLTTK